MRTIWIVLLMISSFELLSYENVKKNDLLSWIELQEGVGVEDSLNWHSNIEDAFMISKESGKPILIYFTGSDWCAPCKMLNHDLFKSQRFSEIKNEFILLKVDFPRRYEKFSQEQKDHNDGLMKKYNKKGSFPNITIVNKKGKKINGIHGYSQLRDTSRHFSVLESIVSKSIAAR